MDTKHPPIDWNIETGTGENAPRILPTNNGLNGTMPNPTIQQQHHPPLQQNTYTGQHAGRVTAYQGQAINAELPWPGTQYFADIYIIRSPLIYDSKNSFSAINNILSNIAVDDLAMLWNTELFHFRCRSRMPNDPAVARACSVYIQRLRDRKSPLLKHLLDTYGIRCRCCRHVAHLQMQYQPGSAHFMNKLDVASVHATLVQLKKHMMECSYTNNLTKAKVAYKPGDFTTASRQHSAFLKFLDFWVVETRALSLQASVARQSVHMERVQQQRQLQTAYANATNGVNHNPAINEHVANGLSKASAPSLTLGNLNFTNATAQQTKFTASTSTPGHGLIRETIADEIAMELEDILHRSVRYHDATQALRNRPSRQRTICSDLTKITAHGKKTVDSPFVALMILRLEIVQRYQRDDDQLQHSPRKKPRLTEHPVTNIAIQCNCCGGQGHCDDGHPNYVDLSQFIGGKETNSAANLVYELGYHHLVNCCKTPQSIRRFMMKYRPSEDSAQSHSDVQALKLHLKAWLEWICKNVLPICKSKAVKPISSRKDTPMWVPVAISKTTTRRAGTRNNLPTVMQQNNVESQDSRDEQEMPIMAQFAGYDPKHVVMDIHNNNHEGNLRFWTLVCRWRHEYLLASESQQLTIVHHILSEIIHDGGRFVVVAGGEGPRSIPDDQLIEWVRRSLEDGCHVATIDHSTKKPTKPGSGVLDLESGPYQDLLFNDVSWDLASHRGGPKSNTRLNGNS